jgi:hypothetical protein
MAIVKAITSSAMGRLLAQNRSRVTHPNGDFFGCLPVQRESRRAGEEHPSLAAMAPLEPGCRTASYLNRLERVDDLPWARSGA